MHTQRDRTLILAYLSLGALALVGTWSQNILFFRETGTTSAITFIEACFANHAAASISIDILFFAAAAFVFMGVEARRLKLPYFWLYVALSFVVAVAVAFPLFMAVRQQRLSRAGMS
jgi:hypothetical protein